MGQSLVELGAQFAERRKERKLSLKEVESATSIRIGYLEAIEAGDMDKLISPVYAQGFVRQYAAFLGLEGDRLVAEHADVFRRPIVQDFAYGIGTLETRGHPGAGVKGLPHIVWFLVLCATVGITFVVAKALELW